MSRFHTSPLLASVLSICKSYWFPFWQKNNNKKRRLKKLQKCGSVTPPKFDRETTSSRRTRGVEFMLCSQFKKFRIKMFWNQAWVRWSRTSKAVQKSYKCCKNVVKIAMSWQYSMCWISLLATSAPGLIRTRLDLTCPCWAYEDVEM